MQREEFTVTNVKCGGCVSAIQSGLQDLPGVSAVQVDQASGKVTVSGSDLSRQQLSTRLTALGYPEA